MSLAPGSTLGAFRIVEPLGAGGMGEVYRAHDTTLGREVAIKILPPSFANDPERLARFEREARLLAALNHPNVATIHGLQASGQLKFLEMEYVPGSTLAQIIAQGPIAVEDVLPICKQIAEALEAAHGRGIVHRDLKPANVKVTPDGRVKVLDFGVAKASEPESAAAPSSQTPTYTSGPTLAGMMVGTIGYMSPEQVRGRVVDRRADVWAFGCMLYEALSGRRPFAAATTSDVLAAILKEEPDWSALADVPPWLVRLTRRCLQKDPSLRIHDIADVRLEIGEALTNPALVDQAVRGPAVTSVPRRHIAAAMVIALGVGLTAGGIAAWLFSTPAVNDGSLARFVMTLGMDQRLEPGLSPSLAISADGQRVAYVASSPDRRTQLFLRAQDRFDVTPLPGTEAATAPFFSPDGGWVGFYAGGALRRVSLEGGVPLTICDAPAVWSATWAADDTILFATIAPNGLWRVPAAGGTPERLTAPNPDAGELLHAYPQVLPGGRDVLFSIVTERVWQIAILSLEDRAWQPISQAGVGGPGARYVPTGHLVYEQSGGLVAVPFDLERKEAYGFPAALLDRVSIAHFGGASFAASDSGALVYLPSSTALADRALVWVDREGRAQPAWKEPAPFSHPQLSADGRRVTVAIASEGGRDIWMYDLARGARSRLTSDGVSDFPVWTPDEDSVTFQSSRPTLWTLYSRPLDSGGTQAALLSGPPPEETSPAQKLAALLPGTLPQLSGANPQYPMSWSPTGEALAFDERKPSGERDIWVLLRGDDPMPFLVSTYDEGLARFSPDGRWLAYVSDESGRSEVYVQPYPGPGEKWPISTSGGTEPLWAPDGSELFYRSGDRLMAVPVTTEPTFNAGTPRLLFEGRYEHSGYRANYDVAPDGRRFLMIHGEGSAPSLRLHVVLNWFDEVRARGATPR